MKKTVTFFLLVSMITMMMVGCSDQEGNEISTSSSDVEIQESSDYSKNSDISQYNDITSISTYIKEQFDAGALQIETMVTNDNINDFEENERISEIFSNDQYFYKALMIDDNTTIVQKNVIFQSATGYIATKNEMLDTVEDERYKNPILNIPSSFGYDGNILSVDDYLGEFEEWHLYIYSAGL